MIDERFVNYFFTSDMIFKKSYPCSHITPNPSHKRLQNDSFPAQYIIPKIGIKPYYITPLRKYLQNGTKYH